MLYNQAKKTAQPFTNAKTGKPWPMPLKDADMERILERLDRIIRDVGPLIDHIENRIGKVETEGMEDYYLILEHLNNFLLEANVLIKSI